MIETAMIKGEELSTVWIDILDCESIMIMMSHADGSIQVAETTVNEDVIGQAGCNN